MLKKSIRILAAGGAGALLGVVMALLPNGTVAPVGVGIMGVILVAALERVASAGVFVQLPHQPPPVGRFSAAAGSAKVAAMLEVAGGPGREIVALLRERGVMFWAVPIVEDASERSDVVETADDIQLDAGEWEDVLRDAPASGKYKVRQFCRVRFWRTNAETWTVNYEGTEFTGSLVAAAKALARMQQKRADAAVSNVPGASGAN